MSDERWYFSKEQIENSPSRRLGIDADQELNYKQLAANLIYDMGSRKLLSVNQLCISTAIVYMHRFYVFHSFTHFQWHTIAMASLFLAAKVEEQTRKLEHIIKTAQWCLQKSQANVSCTSVSYLDQVQELVMNENILLQTLGFDVNVKHPHTFVVEFCEKIKLNKDITKTMYGMASNSLNVTSMCVQYKPSVVACFCIHFICKWSNHRIKMKDESQTWWSYIDPSVTQELLEQMIIEFLHAYEKSPPKLKCKIQELLKCRNLSSHHADHKFDATGRSSSDSFCHSSVSTSTSSSSSFASTFASSAMFQVQKHGETSTGNHNFHGSARMHRSSTNYLSNRHQSSRAAANTPACSAGINGGINSYTSTQIDPSQYIKSNPATHVSSSQPQHHQRRYSSQHQQHYHHRHHVGQTLSNSKHTHKPTSNEIHDAPKPKVTTISHSTSTSHNNVISMKQYMEPDPPMVNEIIKKSGIVVKQEPDYHLPCTTTSNHSHQKVYYPSGSVTSNIIQEISSAQPIEHRIEVNTEPLENGVNLYSATDTVDSSTYNVVIAKPLRTHSIFSPSPVHNESTFSIEVPIKQEVSLFEEQIIREPLPIERIKQEPSVTIPLHKQVRTDVLFSDLKRDMEKVETVCDYENIFRKNLTTAAPSAYVNEQPVITNVVTLAPSSNVESIREEKTEIKSEPCEHSEHFSTKLPLPSKCSEKNAVVDDRIGNANSSDYSSESCRKMKKDKHPKEKKWHNDDRHCHHKDYRSRDKLCKKPEPIKIAIPKEKLSNIPANLKLKMNLDRIATPSTSSIDARLNDSSQNVSKSLKRKRESDQDLSSGTHFYNSQNSFKDCL